MPKHLLASLLVLLVAKGSFGQSHPTIDSLLQVLDTVQARQKPYVQQELAFAYELYANLLQTRQYTQQVLLELNNEAYPTVAIEMYALLAYTYLQNNVYDTAMYYHKRENQVANQAGLTDAAGLSLSRIGVVFLDMHKYDSAKWYIEQGMQTLEQSANKMYRYKVYTHYANLLVFIGKLVQAQDFYLKALKMVVFILGVKYLNGILIERLKGR